MQDYLAEKRKNHAMQLIISRLQQYEEGWNPPFETHLIDIKYHYGELLNHLLNDFSLYFDVNEASTLDLIDKLVDKGILPPFLC